MVSKLDSNAEKAQKEDTNAAKDARKKVALLKESASFVLPNHNNANKSVGGSIFVANALLLLASAEAAGFIFGEDKRDAKEDDGVANVQKDEKATNVCHSIPVAVVLISVPVREQHGGKGILTRRTLPWSRI